MSTYEILITNSCKRMGLYRIETDKNQFRLLPVKLKYDNYASGQEIATVAIFEDKKLVGRITLLTAYGTEIFLGETADDFEGDAIETSFRFAIDLMRSRKAEEIGVGIITSIHIEKGKRILERVLQVLPRILTEFTNDEIDTIIIGKVAAIDLDVNFTEKEYNHIESLLSRNGNEFCSKKAKEVLFRLGYIESETGLLYNEPEIKGGY